MMRLLLCCVALGMILGSVSAREPERSRRLLPAAKLTTPPPKLDGDLTDPAWQSASKALEFVDPQTGLLVPDQTVAYLLYDEQNLYIAFQCRDSSPTGVVGRETVRDMLYQGQDSQRSQEDYVEITFDPFLSYQRNDQTRFAVNPLSTRSARFGGGRAAKAEWSGDWEAIARPTQDGWTAEMRIPWKVLNYPASKSGQKCTMGVNFTRFQYRTQIRSQWSNTTPQGFENLMGRWEGVELPKDAFKPTLSFLPYTLSISDNNHGSSRTGLDTRYQVTPDLTLVASFNPDFATVEGAVQNIAFSRSEQFVEERRPFFLEGGDYFRAGSFYSLGPLFYSNRIENFDFGAKAFGKLTPQDSIGFLMTEDFNHRTDVVTRFQHNLSPTAQVGLFGSQKDTIGGDHNSVGGLFTNQRWGKVGLETQMLASGGRVDTTQAGGRAGNYNLSYQDGNHFTSLQYLTVSPHFQVANGLVFFNDFKGFSGYHNWGREWRGKGAWRSFNVDFGPQYWWHQDGRPFQRGVFTSVNFQTRSDWRLGTDINYNRFEDQTDRTVGFNLVSGATNRFRQYGVNLTTGTQGGHAYRFFGPRLSLRMLKALDVIYQSGVVQQLGWNRQNVMTMSYQLSRTRSLGGRLVTNTAPGKPNATNYYVSYRNAGGKGTELYFLYGDPNAERFRRSVALKLIFAR